MRPNLQALCVAALSKNVWKAQLSLYCKMHAWILDSLYLFDAPLRDSPCHEHWAHWQDEDFYRRPETKIKTTDSLACLCRNYLFMYSRNVFLERLRRETEWAFGIRLLYLEWLLELKEKEFWLEIDKNSKIVEVHHRFFADLVKLRHTDLFALLVTEGEEVVFDEDFVFDDALLRD